MMWFKALYAPLALAPLLSVCGCGSPMPPSSDRVYLRQSAITASSGDAVKVGAVLEFRGQVFDHGRSSAWPREVTLRWESSNASVGTVNDDGVIAASSPGSTIISVSSGTMRDTTTLRVMAPGAPAIVTFDLLSLGGTHSCGLDSAGTTYCWGNNAHGQTGNGSARRYTLTASPVAVAAPSAFSALSVNGEHACALDGFGGAWCWGNNRDGELALGHTVAQPHPTAASTTERFTSISSGVAHVCGVTSTGGLLCWGYNAFGQLSITGGSRSIPTQVSSVSNVKEVAAGGDFTCILNVTGAVSCWGSNAGQVLGLPANVAATPTPNPLSSSAVFTSISAGLRHACAITTAQQVYCWGDNGGGQLGIGTSEPSSPAPTMIASSRLFTRVSAGGTHTCALTTVGEVMCWGTNVEGAVGPTAAAIEPAPVSVPLSETARDVVAAKSGAYSCAVTTESVWCWGSNTSGQLGIGKFSETVDSLRIIRMPRRIAQPF